MILCLSASWWLCCLFVTVNSVVYSFILLFVVVGTYLMFVSSFWV